MAMMQAVVQPLSPGSETMFVLAGVLRPGLRSEFAVFWAAGPRIYGQVCEQGLRLNLRLTTGTATCASAPPASRDPGLGLLKRRRAGFQMEWPTSLVISHLPKQSLIWQAELKAADGSPSLKDPDCRLHAAPAHC